MMYFLMAWTDDPFLSFWAFTAATTIDRVVGLDAPFFAGFFVAFFLGLAAFFLGLFAFFGFDGDLLRLLLLLLDLDRVLGGPIFFATFFLGLLAFFTALGVATLAGDLLRLLLLVRLLLRLLLLDLERFIGLFAMFQCSVKHRMVQPRKPAGNIAFARTW